MVSRAFAALVLVVPTVALGLGICAALYVLGGSAGLRPPPGLVAQESLGALGSEADEAGAKIHSSVRTSAAGTGVVPVIVQIGDREEEVVALIRSVGRRRVAPVHGHPCSRCGDSGGGGRARGRARSGAVGELGRTGDLIGWWWRWWWWVVAALLLVTRPAVALLPVIRPAVALLLVTRPAVALLPVIRPAVALLPVTRPAAALLLVTRPAAALLLVTRPAAALLPVTRQAAVLLPVTRPAAALLPVTRSAAALLLVTRLAPATRPGTTTPASTRMGTTGATTGTAAGTTPGAGERQRQPSRNRGTRSDSRATSCSKPRPRLVGRSWRRRRLAQWRDRTGHRRGRH